MSYVLLVEDNQATADMIVRILGAAGYQVRHSTHGLEGAKMARQDRPSLILMDFNLPDVDGRTMVMVLKRQLGGRYAPPIVAVTARTGDSEMYLAKSVGCDAFVAKPFVPEDLLNLVEEMVKRDATRQKSGESAG